MSKQQNGKTLDLVGTAEAADILEVERPRIGRWLNKWREWNANGRRGPEPETKIPKPIADLMSGPVWHREDIERFAEERRRAKAEATS
jgi:hypothetical protein